MPPHRPLPENVSFPELEEKVLERWRELDVYNESLKRREGAPPYVFYEGPPTANGKPGSHHVLARVFKDIFPRFKTMRGFYSYRKGGWDCHGLPVEIAVQQQLGIDNKKQIEEYGIAEFNAKCRESVFEYLEDWTKLTERIGYWVDLDDPYRTLDTDYIESVWWALGQLWQKDLLYEGFKVVPYCPKDGTALSSHEVSQGYEDVEDPSVFVRYPINQPHGVLREGDELLVWTTTPWTLVSNAAVAVDPELTYVRTANGEVLAEALVTRVIGEEAQVVDRFKGADMVGAGYEPPFPYIPASEYGEKGHTVLPADFVSAEDGTGIVHTAIAFGEDDFRLGAEQGLAVINPVRADGTYDERIGPYEGRFVKEADDDLIEDLRSRGRLFRAEKLFHAYPHCWRCGTPLLYYAKPSWYIKTSQLRDRLLAANESVDWHPEHIKSGRMGRWLENNVDWALSRERYWGTPLPIWRNEAGETVCVGSFAELKELSGVELDDPHRPFVDDVEIPSPTGGEPLRRVPEVIDVWFDSGSMPFAQWHAPFENQEKFEEQFPAHYICEGIDQTRGWFYSLLAISTLLFDRSSYETCLSLGHIADETGKKMSKSLGNIVVPWDVIDRHGADAFRWYFLATKLPWEGYNFNTDTVGESLRQFLLQLWNTYGFYVLYANVNDVAREDVPPANDLDRWVLSRLAATVETVTDRLEHYDATRAGQTIQAFVDDLSNWYVRRSRRRFWDGDPAAFATLRRALVTVTQLLAPFTPFIADEIYDNLDGSEPSVHLTDWPEPGERDEALEFAMATVRETVRLGLAARGQAKLKVRQPLRAAVVVASGAEREAIERLQDLALDELNVKALRYVSQADELGSYEVKPNYRALGPRFGKHMKLVASAVAALDPAHVATALRGGTTVAINVDGHDHELGADDLMLAMSPLEGYQLEREGSHAVALELELDDELRREGLAREIVHAIQNARKSAGLQVEDRIHLGLGGDEELLAAAREHEEYVKRETLALSAEFNGAGAVEPVKIEGRPLHIVVERA
ncbi:isoleucine--tRNA ligase [Solirubrobacter sp. CPCC 204708]|uniref:Isoleucine--tRNA ligase n=1 Tax=Solirubrobacter deserti TaxID=2282478 RepID=A0ABT4RC56_9ACTN|nr:isoleucine--tRNA ligase [Solirubrobacter deserti]MBE2317141.1 isoleucine--tRNA ligase [Solirubrobacter deserti]MDA0135966.1 isoleucine--tRNA ligase [Solirubrobacter deserti]